jgi:tetratricopeptide (TPR) repeat protein
MTRRRWLAVAALSGLLLAAGMQQRYDSTVDYFGERSAFVSLPPGKTLRILSFGYRNLAADMLFIWSIQFYSTYNIRNRFDFIERVYDTITDITPEYKEPYIIGSLIMAHEAQDVPMALRLLDKGSRLNPDEWLFDHDAGFYCYKYLKDYAKAEEYYNRAAAKPGAPVFIKRMKAHLVYLRDDPEVATRMWLDIYRSAEDTLTRDSAFNHLYQIKAEADLPRLRERIAEYRQRYRRLPAALSDLERTGLVREVPRDFAGNEYIYDAADGTVTAQRIFRWKKR